MAVTATPIYPQAGKIESAQLTASDTTTETAALCSGTANGKNVTQIEVISGSTGPRPGSQLAINFYNGSTSRRKEIITLPGGPNAVQARLFLPTCWLATGESLKAQMLETLPSGATLDLIFHSQLY